MSVKKKVRKELTFAERLQKTVDKHNKRVRDNYALYKSLGGGMNQPIDINDSLQEGEEVEP